MGMIVNVYRTSTRDCTLNGISSQHDRLTLVNVEGPFEPDDDAPAAMLIHGNAPGCLRIVPAVQYEGRPNAFYPRDGGVMMGGNYAATSDSRFTEACERLLGYRFYGAVPIHDRIEG
jgi:hypothetical protein